MRHYCVSDEKGREIDVEVLTDEAMKLLELDIDELYATLGGQLLGRSPPTRVAGIMSYLSAIRSESMAKNLYEVLSPGPTPTEWGHRLGAIYEQMKLDGMRHLSEANEDLRKALGNEDFLHLCDEVNRSTMQIVIIIVGAALRIPPEFDSISATLAAILFKLGLRQVFASTVINP